MVRLVRAKIERGKVDLTVSLEQALGAAGRGLIDHALAEAYWRELVGLAEDLGAPSPDLGVILGLPQVLLQRTPSLGGDDAWAAVEPILEEALDALVESRDSEGRSLEVDLTARLGNLRATVEELARLIPGVSQRHQAQYRERVRSLLEREPDEPRIMQEIAILLDRYDVQEELTRLGHHLDSFAGILADEALARKGRKLDFTVQEMMREINTLGSKINDAGVSSLVVDFKTELGRVREQIQNVQ